MYNQRDIIKAFLEVRQSAVGEYETDPRMYRKFLSAVTPAEIPNARRVSDEIMVGDGSRFTRRLKNYYYDSRDGAESGLLNDDGAATFFLDNLGGAITKTARPTGGAFDYTVWQNVATSLPKMRNYLRWLGSEKFIHGDAAINQFDWEQSGSAQPTFNATRRNTGHFDDLTGGSFDVEDLHEALPMRYFDGKLTTLIFTEGANTYNLANEGRLLSLGGSINQNITVKQLPGDPPIDSANPCRGGYARDIKIGTQTATMRFKAYLGTALTEFKAMFENKELTSVTALFKSCETIGSASDKAEFEIKLPRADFLSIQGDSEDEFSAVSVEIQGMQDTVSKGLVTGRVRTTNNLTY